VDQFLAILEKVGPWAALAMFMVWAQWKREQRSESREDRMAKELDRQHDQFVTIIERVTAAIEQSTNTQKILVRVLNERPCISEEETQIVYPPSHNPKRHRTPLPATEALERSA
jgi:hypothetical protein